MLDFTTDFGCTLPPLNTCYREEDGHWCALRHGHTGPHACLCLREWGADRILERARILYRTFYTVHYTEEPEIPSERVIDAACLPSDSIWRRLASEMEKFDEGRKF